MFDNTVNLGDLITVAAFIITLYGFHVTNVRRLTLIEFKVDMMWSRLQKRLGMSDDKHDEE